jgi:hypothetical protein
LQRGTVLVPEVDLVDEIERETVIGLPISRERRWENVILGIFLIGNLAVARDLRQQSRAGDTRGAPGTVYPGARRIERRIASKSFRDELISNCESP